MLLIEVLITVLYKASILDELKDNFVVRIANVMMYSALQRHVTHLLCLVTDVKTRKTSMLLLGKPLRDIKNDVF